MTERGEVARIRTMECMEMVQSSKLVWCSTKGGFRGHPSCVDCEVHYKGSRLYTCCMGHTLDASPNDSNAFNCTAVVCVAPPQSWENGTLVEPGLVPSYG